jgi:hypothetical protein
MSAQITLLFSLFGVLIDILFYREQLVQLLERENLSKKCFIGRNTHNELPNAVTFITLRLLGKLEELVEQDVVVGQLGSREIGLV